MLLLLLCIVALSLNLKPGAFAATAAACGLRMNSVGSSRFSKRLQLPMSIAGVFRSPVTYATRL